MPEQRLILLHYAIPNDPLSREFIVITEDSESECRDHDYWVVPGYVRTSLTDIHAASLTAIPTEVRLFRPRPEDLLPADCDIIEPPSHQSGPADRLEGQQ